MKSEKLNNPITLNFDDEYKKLIDILAQAYQRKPAELLRLLLIPVLHDRYTDLIKDNDAASLKPASYKKYL